MSDWQIVPKEMHADMLAAAVRTMVQEWDHLADEGWQEIWREILAAAPTPHKREEGQGCD